MSAKQKHSGDYLLRPVEKKDLGDLTELAQFLDTINFPNDQEQIEKDIEYSIRSFLGETKDPKDGVFQFVLEDVPLKKVIGVSKVLARHGTKEKPHYFWQISYDRRESSTISIGINHQVLKLGHDNRGHTEIAGIIVHPSYQGQQLGKLLFYVRFIFIALNRQRFADDVISELLPPFNRKGESELWEAYGRKFTGLTYQEADHLSQNNKEFIESLFPQHEIYTVLLPVKAREVIGKVGEKSKPVQHLAEKNGLKFLNQIDPFDGGPHYGCAMKDVIALQQTFMARLTNEDLSKSGKACEGLIAPKNAPGQKFRAVQAQAFSSSEGKTLFCEADVLKSLGLKDKDEVAFLPFT